MLREKFIEKATKVFGASYAALAVGFYDWEFIEDAAAVLLGQDATCPGRWVGFIRKYDDRLWDINSCNSRCWARYGSSKAGNHIAFCHELSSYRVHFVSEAFSIELN